MITPKKQRSHVCRYTNVSITCVYDRGDICIRITSNHDTCLTHLGPASRSRAHLHAKKRRRTYAVGVRHNHITCIHCWPYIYIYIYICTPTRQIIICVPPDPRPDPAHFFQHASQMYQWCIPRRTNARPCWDGELESR